jgi:hypothetical protein
MSSEDGITVRQNPQITSATKSALSGHSRHRNILVANEMKTRRKGDSISIERLQMLDSLVRKVFKQAQREGLVRKKGERS